MITLFPGPFDPFTNGHLDVAECVCVIADRLVIGVGANPARRGLTAPEECVRLIRETTGHLGSVEVILLQGATTDEASRLGATLIVKGVRSSINVDYETPQVVFNREIRGVDTWWILIRPILAHVSPNAVRELVDLKKDISRYIPPVIERPLIDNRS